MTQIVPLTNSPKFVLVDDVDYAKVCKYKWYAEERSHTTYAICTKKFNGRKLRMHRYLLDLTDRKKLTDHINGNGLDNRRNNLRVCNSSENPKNKRVSKARKTSEFKGVSIGKGGRWVVQIAVDGKKKHIGCFGTEVEAAKAYDEAAKFYHKDFANINLKESDKVYREKKYQSKFNNKTSNYIGVNWDKSSNKWISRLQINGKRVYLGLFENEVEAIEACENYKRINH